jgi:pimeloyl-ACP methyl ester carboxylesterase
MCSNRLGRLGLRNPSADTHCADAERRRTSSGYSDGSCGRNINCVSHFAFLQKPDEFNAAVLAFLKE